MLPDDCYVFLDRDGTLIEHVHHLTDYNKVVFKEDLISSLKLLSDFGFSLTIVTNQSVIARGMATLAEVTIINDLLKDHLSQNGINLTDVLICPHMESDYCECRKPKIGMVKDYISQKSIKLTHSFMVGDQSSDIEFGLNIGVKSALLKNGDAGETIADFVGASLTEIAKWIIKEVSVG